MTDYLKQTLKTDLCLSFAESFSANSKDNYFLFLGKPTSWSEPYDDNNPPPVQDTLEQDLEAWRNMIALAKINKSNVLVGATRYNWEYNKVFDQFDHTLDLYEEGNERQFYCITDDFNVYKCISNNYGTPSTIKPTAVTPEEQITQDGYVWKFMCKVREELYEFLTDQFIPIEKLENILYSDERSLQNNVRIGSVPSSIGNAIITQFGGAYPLAIIKDYSTDAKHVITEVLDVNEFKVFPSDDLNKTNDIYNDYYEIYIAEGTGAGYKSVITDYIYEPSENSITIVTENALAVSTDSVYRIYPRIKITGDGTGASVIPVMNDEKVIINFTVLNGGKNYHYANMDVYRVNPTYANKTLGRLILSPLNGHGFDAIKELGSNMVMIYLPLRNAEKVLDPDAKNILTNDYRQIGLIKNTFYNDSEDLVPVSSDEDFKTYIDIENINSKSIIHLVTTDNLTTLLPVGSTLKQGSESNAYQARGTVDSVETDSDSYVITVTNVNGRFLPSSSSTYPLIKEGTTDLEFSGTISGVIVNNLYDNNTFLVDNFILGTTTASTAKITIWECDPYGLSGRIYFTDLKGKFRNSYYAKDTDGDIVLVRGERIVGYESIDVTTGQLEGISPSTVGVIKSIGTVESETKQFYKVTTTLQLTATSGTLESDLFSPDDIISNEYGSEATVISYTVGTDTQNTTASMEITGLTASFGINDILRINNNSTEVVTNARISDIQSPEILPYYGDVIYIQNVTPIVASNDSEEHIKVLIKF
jgi:hypothetical protein